MSVSARISALVADAPNCSAEDFASKALFLLMEANEVLALAERNLNPAYLAESQARECPDPRVHVVLNGRRAGKTWGEIAAGLDVTPERCKEFVGVSPTRRQSSTISKSETGWMLGVTVHTIDRFVANGDLATIRLPGGAHPRFRRADVVALRDCLLHAGSSRKKG